MSDAQNNISQEDDSQYNPRYRIPKDQTLKRKMVSVKAKSINQRQSKWTHEQREQYVIYLKKHRSSFEMKRKPKYQGIFFKMALFIKTRSYTQCRSHHQKMTKNKSIKQFIEEYFKDQKKSNECSNSQSSEIQTLVQKRKYLDFKGSLIQAKQNSQLSICYVRNGNYSQNSDDIEINESLRLEFHKEFQHSIFNVLTLEKIK